MTAALKGSRPRRAYGSGSVFVEPRSRGRNVFVGQFSIAGRQYQRVLGPVRAPGSKDGMTRAMAEGKLREARRHVEKQAHDDASAPPPTATLADVAERHCKHLETVLGRRPQTVQ